MPEYAPIVDRREVTDRYDFIIFPPDDPFPRFKVRHPPRLPNQTDAQDAVSRRSTERHYRVFGIYLGLSQAAATDRGYFRHCAVAACRRAQKCVSRRDEEDWSIFPGPAMPPCCDTLERTEPLRQLIRDVTADFRAGVFDSRRNAPRLVEAGQRVNIIFRGEERG